MPRQRNLYEILNDHENSLRRITTTLARSGAAVPDGAAEEDKLLWNNSTMVWEAKADFATMQRFTADPSITMGAVSHADSQLRFTQGTDHWQIESGNTANTFTARLRFYSSDHASRASDTWYFKGDGSTAYLQWDESAGALKVHDDFRPNADAVHNVGSDTLSFLGGYFLNLYDEAGTLRWDLSGNLTAGGTLGWSGDSDTYISTDTLDQINFYAGAVEMLRISEAGVDQVMIGTIGSASFPGLTTTGDQNTGLQWGVGGADRLSVIAGGVEMLRYVAGATDQINVYENFMMDDAGKYGWANDTDLYIERAAADVMAFWANGKDLRWDGANATFTYGALLIGDTTAEAAQDVWAGNAQAYQGYRASSTTTHEIMTMYSDVGGTAQLKWKVEADGDTNSSTGSYGTISDEVLKDYVLPARDYLDDLRKIVVMKYRLTGHDEEYLGYSAQQVATVFPGLVSETMWGTKSHRDANGDVVPRKERPVKTVKASIFVPMLITAVQELVDRVEALEAAI